MNLEFAENSSLSHDYPHYICSQHQVLLHFLLMYNCKHISLHLLQCIAKSSQYNQCSWAFQILSINTKNDYNTWPRTSNEISKPFENIYIWKRTYWFFWGHFFFKKYQKWFFVCGLVKSHGGIDIMFEKHYFRIPVFDSKLCQNNRWY